MLRGQRLASAHVPLKPNRKEWVARVAEEHVRLLLLLNTANCITHRGIPTRGISLD